jgi:hypothetical protein
LGMGRKRWVAAAMAGAAAVSALLWRSSARSEATQSSDER